MSGQRRMRLGSLGAVSFKTMEMGLDNNRVQRGEGEASITIFLVLFNTNFNPSSTLLI